MSERKEQKQLIDGAVGTIELLLTESVNPSHLVICCHPHPLHGGAMTNKVIHTVDKTMNQLGMHTIRFNFRGVGRSVGEYADGIGEQDDVLAVYQWAKQKYPDLPIALAGFSFGAYVTAMVSQRIQPAFLISVAPPVARFNFSAFQRPECPWIVVMGDADELVVPENVYQWVLSFEDNQPLLLKMDRACHFFHSRLIDMRARLANAMQYTLSLTSKNTKPI
jgi:uncharacterized protein